jgi:hypothetical protein
MNAPEDRLGNQSSDDAPRATALIPQADLAGSRRDVSEVPDSDFSRRSNYVVILSPRRRRRAEIAAL